MITPQGLGVIANMGSWGRVSFRHSAPDRLYGVIAVSDGGGVHMPVSLPSDHFLSRADVSPGGLWFAVDPGVHMGSLDLSRKDAQVTFAAFQSAVPVARDPGAGAYIALTICHDLIADSDLGVPIACAWFVSKDEVRPMDFSILTGLSRVSQLAPAWPAHLMSDATVTIVGAGSLGSAAAVCLAAYGVGKINLVDPDRLLSHNVIRHAIGRQGVGRYKVDALAEELPRAWPSSAFVPHRLDIVEDADRFRELLGESTAVICTVDGVAPRRVVSHLTRRAGVDAILACVLVDGRYGEVLRLRNSADIGCLNCQRQRFRDAGKMDLETTLDREYGTGTRHNPMTAVGGDLMLVSALAARVAIASLLSAGESHLLPFLSGDNAFISLQPEPGWLKPFDSQRAVEINWEKAGAPFDDCPTCGQP
jgi:hypothetical protein